MCGIYICFLYECKQKIFQRRIRSKSVINGKESQIKLDFQTRNNLLSIRTVRSNNNQLDQDSARRSSLEVLVLTDIQIASAPNILHFLYINKKTLYTKYCNNMNLFGQISLFFCLFDILTKLTI